MKLLTVAFALLLSKTCAENQWRKVWTEFLKQIRVVKILFTSNEHAILSRNKNVISFSTRPSPRPLMTSVHCHLQEEGKMSFYKAKEDIYLRTKVVTECKSVFYPKAFCMHASKFQRVTSSRFVLSATERKLKY